MPEEGYHENDSSPNVRRFEEFVAKVSACHVSYSLRVHAFSTDSPYGGMGCKGEPRLEDNRHYAGPVEHKT